MLPPYAVPRTHQSCCYVVFLHGCCKFPSRPRKREKPPLNCCVGQAHTTSWDVCRGTRNFPPAAGLCTVSSIGYHRNKEETVVDHWSQSNRSITAPYHELKQWISCNAISLDCMTDILGSCPSKTFPLPAQAEEAFLLMLLGLRDSQWELTPGTAGSRNTCTYTYTLTKHFRTECDS